MISRSFFKKRVLPLALAALLLILTVILVLSLGQTPRDGSFDVPEEIEMALLRSRAAQNGLVLEGASESEIREAANGEIDRLIRIETGYITDNIALGHSMEQILADAGDYYYCRIVNIKRTEKDGRITRSEAELYFMVASDGSVVPTSTLPVWTELYTYAHSPQKALGLFARPDRVYCMDEPVGRIGTVIYYDMGRSSKVLYYADGVAYLAPASEFAKACTDAYNKWKENNEQTGSIVGLPTPANGLGEYRRADLDLTGATPPQKTETDSYLKIIVWEIIIGAILFVPILLWKRYEWKQFRAHLAMEEAARMTEAETPVDTLPAETSATDTSPADTSATETSATDTSATDISDEASDEAERECETAAAE